MHNIKHCKDWKAEHHLQEHNKTQIQKKKKEKKRKEKEKDIKSYNCKSIYIHSLIKYIWSPQIYRERTFWLIRFEYELQWVVDSFEFCTENNLKGCNFESAVNSYSYYETLRFSFS
jgi:hypothetical protein